MGSLEDAHREYRFPGSYPEVMIHPLWGRAEKTVRLISTPCGPKAGVPRLRSKKHQVRRYRKHCVSQGFVGWVIYTEVLLAESFTLGHQQASCSETRYEIAPNLRVPLELDTQGKTFGCTGKDLSQRLIEDSVDGQSGILQPTLHLMGSLWLWNRKHFPGCPF